MKPPAQTTRAKFEMLASLYGWTVASYGNYTNVVYLYRETADGFRRTALLYTSHSDEELIAEFKYAERYK